MMMMMKMMIMVVELTSPSVPDCAKYFLFPALVFVFEAEVEIQCYIFSHA